MNSRPSRLSLPMKRVQLSKPYYFYLLRCRDQSFYAGIAIDLKKRFQDHRSGRGSAYVKSRWPAELVYFEKHPSRSLALRREAAVKNFSRRQKIELIQSGYSQKN